MTKFRCIIAGSRSFYNYELLKQKCNYYLQNKFNTDKVVIVSGCAPGADRLAIKYANELNLQVQEFPAKWEDDKGRFIRSAGFVRNLEMANNADALIAFWDGKSKGTAHMISVAREYNLLVRIVKI